MPKQRGPYKIEGFFDGKIYYKMGKDWYFRNSSAPSAEKSKKIRPSNLSGIIQKSLVLLRLWAHHLKNLLV